MKFFTYRQNNSGGSFTKPARFVIIEARNAYMANEVAKDNDLYFDGCSNGTDCSCCGDRWGACDDSDGTDTPNVYGETDMHAVASDRWYRDTRSMPVVMVIEWNGTTTKYPA